MFGCFTTPYRVPDTRAAMLATAKRVAKEVQDYCRANACVPVGMYWTPGQHPHGGPPVLEQQLHVACVPNAHAGYVPRVWLYVGGMGSESVSCPDRCDHYAMATPPCDCSEAVPTAPGQWGWWVWVLGVDNVAGDGVDATAVHLLE